MKFKGDEAVSRATRATGRTLIVLCFMLASHKVGWIETTEASVFGVRIAPGKLEVVLTVLVVTVAIGHLVQWYGDKVSFDGWNVDGNEIGDVRFGSGPVKRLDGLTFDLSKLAEKTGNDDRIDPKAIERLLAEVESINLRISQFSRFSFVYFYVWHFAVPIGLALAVSL